MTNPRQYAVKFPYVYDELMRYLDSHDSTVLKCHTQCRKYFGDQQKLEANLKDSVLTVDESISRSSDEMTVTSASTSAASIPKTKAKSSRFHYQVTARGKALFVTERGKNTVARSKS